MSPQTGCPSGPLLLGVEVVRVVSAATAGVLAVTGVLQLWHLAVIAFVLGAAEAFFFPAYSAILPALLPADELLAANGVEGTLRPVAQQALGPALAGVLVGAFSPSAALLLAAGIYALAAITLVAMRRVAVVPSAEAHLRARRPAPRASATCSAPAGCSPRWPSPSSTCSC